MREFSARLHVLLASKAPTAVVIRRGPSKSVCTILWNREADTFRLGQWLRGRIFERRSDISPDGNHLIYFAFNGRWKSKVGGSWTAISRAPFLKAVSLFAKGDAWHGGGLFTSKSRFWLNNGRGHRSVEESSEVVRDEHFAPVKDYGGECPGVYYVKLQRDGWLHVADRTMRKWHVVSVFEKPARAGWLLRKLAHAQVGSAPGKGCYWDEHELEHKESNTHVLLPEWEWADIDRTRIVWAKNGQLWAGQLLKTGLCNEKLVHDFNHMKFEPIKAPY
jgi:hypothetical protein